MKLTKALAGLTLAAATLPGVAAQTAAPTVGGVSAASPSIAEQQLRRHAHLTLAQQKLKTFSRIFAYSDTVYLDSKVLEEALMKRFEIHAWKIAWSDKGSADVRIKVWRPTFTFDWRYRMADSATGQELGAGRIVAWDGKRAADALAADIARHIARVRPLPTHLLAAFDDEPSARKWEFKYHAGSEGPRQGVPLTVSVSPERIVGRRQNRVVFVVPARSVSSVGYNPVVTDATKGWNKFWDGFASDVDPTTLLASVPIWLLGEAILKPMSRTEHICDIAWLDNGAMRDVWLKTDKKETAQEFLAAVKDVTRREAVDVQVEATALWEAIKREDREARSIPIKLDKKTAVGWKVLEPGLYRVVVVERASRPSIAYFIPDTGALQINNIAAQMPVAIEPPVSEPTPQPVSYREADGIVSIDAIATTARTLRFRAIPIADATEPQISEDMEELLTQAALKPKYRSVHVKSGTVYLKRDVMEQALAQHPAFIEWEVKVAPRPEEADLALVVTRPFLTFDWKYVVTEVKTANKLVEGKITARDGGRAATLIADQLVNALKAKAAQEIEDHNAK